MKTKRKYFFLFLLFGIFSHNFLECLDRLRQLARNKEFTQNSKRTFSRQIWTDTKTSYMGVTTNVIRLYFCSNIK